MDNTVIYKFKIVRQTIEKSGNHLLYSVPYHPETNAIEEFFSQLKHYIKKHSPNTYDDIQLVIKDIIKYNITNYLKNSFRMYKNK